MTESNQSELEMSRIGAVEKDNLSTHNSQVYRMTTSLCSWLKSRFFL